MITEKSPPRICPKCKIRNVEIFNNFYTKKCISCTNKPHNVSKEVKDFAKRVCKYCEKEFTPETKKQKYCGNPCTYRSVRENKNFKEEWLNKKERKFKPDNDLVANSFFKKKYGISKIYKVCRG